MKFALKFTLALAALAALAGDAAAQERQPGGGRRPGGMMAGPGAGGGLMLLSNKSVQEELKLSEEQVEKAKAASEKAQGEMREVFAKMMKDGDLQRDGDREKMAEKMREAFKPLRESGKKTVAEILKPEQVQRLQQIELQAAYQMAGASALLNEEVSTALKVTDEQKTKLKGIGEEYTKEMGELRRNAGDNPGEARQKATALREEAQEKVEKVLSDEQRKQWKEMTGEKFQLRMEGGQRPGGNRPRDNDRPRDDK